MNHQVACSNCGHLVTIPCYQKRHGEIGGGFHGAKEVTSLSGLCIRIVDVLGGRHSYEQGLTSWGVYVELKKGYGPQERMPVLNTVRGRLSTMAGPGLQIVKVERNNIQVTDRATMEFRFEGQERWFTNAQPTLTALRLIEEARARKREMVV